jgi:hypothetical protein
MINFNKDWISDEYGFKIIRGFRKKTGVMFVSLLLPEAEKVLKKYKGLPKISNQKYNDYLGVLSSGAGINKSVTSHVARQTFRLIALGQWQ